MISEHQIPPGLSTVTDCPLDSLLVIGLGSAGYRHLMNAKALGVGDLSVLHTGCGVLKGPFPEGVRMEHDLGTALSRGVTGAVIANPTSLHVRSAVEVVKAGCHLLIEKPLGDTMEGIDTLLGEVGRRGLIAVLGYQFRFHPSLQRIRQWLREGAIGDVVCAHAVWGEFLPSWQPWRDYRTSYSARTDLGGGVLLTLSHPIDYLRWLLGEVAAVSAVTARRSGLELDVEDTALVHLVFDSGVIASVALDYVQWPPQHRLTIVGSRGTITWDNADGIATLHASVSRPLRRDTCYPPEDFERNHLFVAELNRFFDCIACPELDDDVISTVEDGARTVRICLAAQESAREGRRVDVSIR